MSKNSLTRQRQCKACCAPAVVDDWGWCCVGSVQSAKCYSVPCRVLFHCKVFCHGPSVQEQYVGCTLCRYTMGCCSVPWSVDNSDSPSTVEQSQQGADSSCILCLFLVSGSVEYPIPYAYCLASCSVGWRISLGVLLVSWCLLTFPLVLPVYCSSSLSFGLLQPLLFRVFHIVPWVMCIMV